jgi:hypothetical protein
MIDEPDQLIADLEICRYILFKIEDKESNFTPKMEVEKRQLSEYTYNLTRNQDGDPDFENLKRNG